MVLISSLLLSTAGFAQQQESEYTETERLEQQRYVDAVRGHQKFKMSGYIQAQYQWGEQGAKLKVGSANENPEKSFNRFGIRRGRIKLQYERGIASGVFQIDLTEKGVGVKNVYLNIKDPWVGTSSFKAGIFDRPFGYEISYSSSKRESPERSTIFQTLFPEERDLGAQITLQPSKTSSLNFLRLDAGLFAGNGIKQETDNRKDFIGHLSANSGIGSDIKYGLGVSYYNGSVYQGTENVYTMSGNGFKLNSDANNKGRFAKREYVGLDGQFIVASVLGLTQLRGEYLFGTQPGSKSNSKSPNASTLPSTDTYIRKFRGGYVMLVQDFGQSPFSAVVKYDWYDPNTKVSGNEIGLNETDKGDIAVNTIGFGILWRINDNIRLQAYYEINKNEKTENLAAFKNDISDNVFTLRLQYKF